MSFGVSITDIITLAQLTHGVYKRWHAACGDYAEITADLELLKTLLESVQEEAESSDSVLSRDDKHGAQWTQLSKRCTITVTEIGSVLDKYRDLTREPTIVARWRRIQVATSSELPRLNRQLTSTTERISVFVGMIGFKSQMRIEKKMLPMMAQLVDEAAAKIRKGNGSTWTVYADDDVDVWRQFRRDLRMRGFTSKDIKYNSEALKAYISQLKDNGLLEEESPHDLISEEPNSEERGCATSPATYQERVSPPRDERHGLETTETRESEERGTGSAKIMQSQESTTSTAEPQHEPPHTSADRERHAHSHACGQPNHQRTDSKMENDPACTPDKRSTSSTNTSKDKHGTRKSGFKHKSAAKTSQCFQTETSAAHKESSTSVPPPPPPPGITITGNKGGDLPPRIRAERFALTWTNKNPAATDGLREILLAQPEPRLLPDGWIFKRDLFGRCVYIDGYAKGLERRCFARMPQRESVLPVELGWRRICNPYGRVYWEHVDSGFTVYRHPTAVKPALLAIGGKICIFRGRRLVDVSLLDEAAQVRILNGGDDNDFCQVEKETWNLGKWVHVDRTGCWHELAQESIKAGDGDIMRKLGRCPLRPKFRV